MTNLQRVILGTCAIALCAYLIFLGGHVTTRSADPARPGVTGPVEQTVEDAVASLANFGIALEPYRHGEIRYDGGTLRVARNGDDGFGIFLKPTDTLESGIIRFEAKGDARIVVRSTVAGVRQYRDAVSSDFLRISDETDEVLIFTDDADYIEIDIREVRDCRVNWDSLCADENYMAEEIGLAEASLSKKSELLKIVDWAANEVIWSSERPLSLEANELIKKYTAAQMYSMVYEAEAGGGYCGASAVFLAKLLNEFGYSAFTINFGAGSDLTHVTTLVYNPFGEGKFYMVDPTFNAVFIDPESGEWIAMEDILSGRVEDIQLDFQPVENRRFMTTSDREYLVDCRPAKGRANTQICSRPGYSFNNYLASFGSAFEEAGLTADQAGYVRLLRHTYYSVGNQAGSDVRDQFVALLDANQIAIER